MEKPTANSWRFGLRFKRVCPFAPGDKVLSGIVDDYGQQVRFAGSASVEKTENKTERASEVRSRAVVLVKPLP